MSETRFSHVPTIVRGVQRQVLLPAMLLASSSVLLLSGCGAALNLGQGAAGPAELGEMHGSVHGGQAPVEGALVTIYEIGATAATAGGYGVALPQAANGTVPALPVLGTATTDGDGNWTIASPAACVNAADELYLVASSGREIGNTTANSSLVLTSVGGPCGNQFTHNWNIDEVSTVVTEYALAGFATSYQNVGTSVGNSVGLTNAFATVNNLISLGGGSAYLITPAYASSPANTTPDVFRSIVPADLINSLANVLAACVNENDNGTASGGSCENLFALTNGAVSNTADAALYMAHNPGGPAPASSSWAGQVLALPTPQAPFGPTLTTTPNDLTMTVNFVGGGLGGAAALNRSKATGLVIDQQGDVWSTAAGLNTVIELNNLGVPLSPNTLVNTANGATITKGGFPPVASGPAVPQGIAIDQNGNAWVADSDNCLEALSPSGTPLTGSPFTTVSSAGGPISLCANGDPGNSVSVDASNNIWVLGAITGENFISAMSYGGGTGTILHSGFPYTGSFSALTGFFGPDYSGHMWWVDGGDGEYGALTSSASSYANTGEVLSSPSGVSAFDNISGTLELAIPQGGGTESVQLAKLGSSPVLGSESSPNSEAGPQGTAVDGAGNILFVNSGGTNGANTVPNNVTVLTKSLSEVSNSVDGWTGGSSLMSLDQAAALAIDQSGNAWVLNASNPNNKNTDPAYTNSNGIPYKYTGSNCANVTEIIGLATPVNPVPATAAAIGAGGVTTAGAYGVAP